MAIQASAFKYDLSRLSGMTEALVGGACRIVVAHAITVQMLVVVLMMGSNNRGSACTTLTEHRCSVHRSSIVGEGTWIKLRLRGGSAKSVRPGTIDYRKWEDLAKDLSDDEPSITVPRVTEMKRPSKVTFGGGLDEIVIQEEDDDEEEEEQEQQQRSKRTHYSELAMTPTNCAAPRQHEECTEIRPPLKCSLKESRTAMPTERPPPRTHTRKKPNDSSYGHMSQTTSTMEAQDARDSEYARHQNSGWEAASSEQKAASVAPSREAGKRGGPAARARSSGSTRTGSQPLPRMPREMTSALELDAYLSKYAACAAASNLAAGDEDGGPEPEDYLSEYEAEEAAKLSTPPHLHRCGA
jgi:hypothetical protein